MLHCNEMFSASDIMPTIRIEAANERHTSSARDADISETLAHTMT